MRLKLFRAPSVAEAMSQVRIELGPEALILSTRRLADGVELTAALELDDEPAYAPLPPATLASAADLSFHGVPEKLAQSLGPHRSVDELAQALARLLRFDTLPVIADNHGGRPLLVAGMPGAGKTLSIARLATRLVLSGVRPTVITADGRRAGAAEELAAFTRLLGIKLLVASTPATLVRALASAAEHQEAPSPVLIDSSGINPFATGEVAGVAALAEAADAVPVLVMQAGLDASDAAEQVAAFAPIGARHLLVTRLDLTRRFGSIISAAASGLALTEASSGPGAADPLQPMTPAFLAERLFGVAEPVTPQVRPDLKRPVFPSARAHAAQAWSNSSHV